MRYRVTHPLMVLAFKENHDAAVPVPPGRIIEILGADIDDRFTRVRVDKEEFLVFESDLKKQGTYLAQKPNGGVSLMHLRAAS